MVTITRTGQGQTWSTKQQYSQGLQQLHLGLYYCVNSFCISHHELLYTIAKSFVIAHMIKILNTFLRKKNKPPLGHRTDLIFTFAFQPLSMLLHILYSLIITVNIQFCILLTKPFFFFKHLFFHIDSALGAHLCWISVFLLRAHH